MAPFCLPYGRLGLQGAKRLGYKANPTDDYESIFFKFFRPHVRFVIVVCIWLVFFKHTRVFSLISTSGYAQLSPRYTVEGYFCHFPPSFALSFEIKREFFSLKFNMILCNGILMSQKRLTSNFHFRVYSKCGKNHRLER